jgi:UDP-N-acetyl-D-glucosamine dehydrogenase
MSVTLRRIDRRPHVGRVAPLATIGLAEKLAAPQAHVVVMGLGYAGLPMAVEFARAGFRVTGLDVDERRVQLVNRGQSPVSDVADVAISQLVDDGRLQATGCFDSLASADCVLICVPTPLMAGREPDLTFIRSAAHAIAEHVHPEMLVILQSTCTPGTTRRVLLPILEAGTRWRAGEDYFVAFAPERIDPGNPNFNLRNTPKIVGGLTPRCSRLASLLFQPIVDRIVKVSSPEVAEMTKLVENAFRFINISFINEMAVLCDSLNVDIWETIEAAATKPFAFMPHYPGPGVGGHCIPIVPFFLEAAARERGVPGYMIDAAGKVNDRMPEFVVRKLERLLAARHKSLARARVLLLGIAYKRDTNDIRESPAFPVLRQLRQRGAEVAYYDPYVPSVCWDGASLQSLTAAELGEGRFDCAVLVTDHTGIEYAALGQRVDVLLDTRGHLASIEGGTLARL